MITWQEQHTSAWPPVERDDLDIGKEGASVLEDENLLYNQKQQAKEENRAIYCEKRLEFGRVGGQEW